MSFSFWIAQLAKNLLTSSIYTAVSWRKNVPACSLCALNSEKDSRSIYTQIQISFLRRTKSSREKYQGKTAGKETEQNDTQVFNYFPSTSNPSESLLFALERFTSVLLTFQVNVISHFSLAQNLACNWRRYVLPHIFIFSHLRTKPKQPKAWTAAEDKVLLHSMEAHCCSLSWPHSSICVISQMSKWSFWELMANFLTWFTMQVYKFQRQCGKGKESGWDRQQNVTASYSVTTHTSTDKLHSNPE